jgi:hypothetical protein
MDGVVGTLSIYFDDGEGELEVVTLVSATLQRQTEMVKAHDPGATGWAYSVPDEQSWRVGGAYIEVLDTEFGQRSIWLVRLDAAWTSKTPLACRFQSPLGEEYEGEGFLDTFQLGEAYDAGYRGVFGIEGRSVLTPVVEGEGEGEGEGE